MQMPEMPSWLNKVLSVLPLIALLSTSLMWIDTRYLHRDISDTRYIDLQIKIVQGHTRDYERMKDSGIKISANDESNYRIDMKQLEYLMVERNRTLGLDQ